MTYFVILTVIISTFYHLKIIKVVDSLLFACLAAISDQTKQVLKMWKLLLCLIIIA